MARPTLCKIRIPSRLRDRQRFDQTPSFTAAASSRNVPAAPTYMASASPLLILRHASATETESGTVDENTSDESIAPRTVLAVDGSLLVIPLSSKEADCLSDSHHRPWNERRVIRRFVLCQWAPPGVAWGRSRLSPCRAECSDNVRSCSMSCGGKTSEQADHE